MTLAEISALVEGELQGDPQLKITGVSGIEDAQPGQITYAADNKNLKLLEKSRASAVLCREGDQTELPVVRVAHPQLAFAKLMEIYHPAPRIEPGVDERAFLGSGVKLGREVKIYPFAYIGDGARIGNGVVIGPGASIGAGVTVGDDTVIHANVSIYANVSIGRRVVIHSGAVIGGDGFGYTQREDGSHYKIPQVGTVEIEDDVEIGANVGIDRATLGVTLIRKGAKMDNLVHVAHNNLVGENTILLAQVGLSGSCRVGRNVILAGQVGTIDHVSIGDNTIVIAQSGVAQDVPPGSLVSGTPAVPHQLWKKIQLSLTRLPQIVKRIRKLEKTLEKLNREAGDEE